MGSPVDFSSIKDAMGCNPTLPSSNGHVTLGTNENSKILMSHGHKAFM